MANKEHLQRLLEAVASGDSASWNQWRKENPHLKPDLGQGDLSKANLRCADLSDANLSGANLADAHLAGANLNGANLNDASLRAADLSGANMRCAHLRRANLNGANLTGTDLRFAELRGAILSDAKLFHARINPADYGGAGLKGIDLNNHRTDARAIRWKGVPMRAGVTWLVNIALRLFKHREVVTLGLTGSSKVNQNEPPGANAAPPPTEPPKLP